MAAVPRGINAAARGCNLRLQRQIPRYAPRTEGAHGNDAAGCLQIRCHTAGNHHAAGVAPRRILDRLGQNGFHLVLPHGDTGQLAGQGHVDGTGLIVVNDGAGCTGIHGMLLLIREVHAAAPGNQHNFSRHIQRREILRRAAVLHRILGVRRISQEQIVIRRTRPLL